MNNRIPFGPRGSQILKLLFDHGPLSTSTLQSVIEPPMSTRKMNEAVSRLKDLGLVKKRYYSTAEQPKSYIELSQKGPAKEVFKSAFNVSEEDMMRAPGTTDALEHWQECVLWAKRFRTMLGGAKIIHDFQMWRSKEIRSIFKLSEKAKIHAYPDLMAVIEKPDAKPCTIAIEVERTEKSAFRIIRKLRTLAITSQINGVLYICSTPRVAEKIRRIYRTYVLPRAYRVERYADQFLLISDGTIDPVSGMLAATDLKGSGINPVAWMMKLQQREEEPKARKS